MGITNVWSVPVSSLESNNFIAPILNLLKNLIKIYISSGIIYTFHLFANDYWYPFYIALSLPKIKTFRFFSKFYRVFTITNIRLKLKKKYILRKNSQNLQIVISDPILYQDRLWFHLFVLPNSSNFLNWSVTNMQSIQNIRRSFTYLLLINLYIQYLTINTL